ncbi:MAG: hypothetical protein PVF91_04690 [Chromatiales bacterium]
MTGIHAAAVGTCLALPFGWGGRAALAGLVLLGLADALRAHVLHRGDTAVRSAEWRGRGEWWVRRADGTVEAARLHHSTLVLPWLVVLRLSVGRLHRRTLVLPADALAADTHRRLRAALLAGEPADQGRGA